jgi:competence ComEA-like helix-hairpin-helix protein
VDERVDINHCTITALKKLGFSLPMAKTIKERRPYKSVLDLKQVPGMKATQYRIMEPKLCCTPIIEEPKQEVLPEPEPEEAVNVKVNVNTVENARKLTELTGMAVRSSQGILRYRSENGPFATLDDLLKVPEFGAICMKRYRDKLEV